MENKTAGKALSGYFQTLFTAQERKVREEEKPHELLCPDCDLLVFIPALMQRQVASCPRCSRTLEKHAYYRIQTPLALVITGLLLYILANIYPVLTLELAG